MFTHLSCRAGLEVRLDRKATIMNDEILTWGPIARAIYVALLWTTALVAYFASSLLFYYLLFLVFLGLGLRPLLEKTGVADVWNARSHARREKRWQEVRQKNALEVRRARHAERHKRRRTRDPELPKHW